MLNTMPCLFHLAATTSTMQEAENIITNLNPAPEEFIVIADTQTSGLGRNQNLWQSPLGGLWFSYCLKTIEVSHQVTLLLGLVLRDVLAEQYPYLESGLMIKWPNDLMLNGKKLAGILVKQFQSFLVIGIGINTNNRIPVLSGGWKPVSIAESLSFHVSNMGILSNFLAAFIAEYHTYCKFGINGYVEKINQHLFGRNMTTVFSTDSSVLKGICKGIAKDGALQLLDENGNTISCYAGSVIRIVE